MGGGGGRGEGSDRTLSPACSAALDLSITILSTVSSSYGHVSYSGEKYINELHQREQRGPLCWEHLTLADLYSVFTILPRTASSRKQFWPLSLASCPSLQAEF